MPLGDVGGPQTRHDPKNLDKKGYWQEELNKAPTTWGAMENHNKIDEQPRVENYAMVFGYQFQDIHSIENKAMQTPAKPDPMMATITESSSRCTTTASLEHQR